MLYGDYAFDYHRPEINDELLKPNLGFICTKQTKDNFACLVVDMPVGQHKLATAYDGSYISPLYLYTREKQDLLDDAPQQKRANFSPEFLAALHAKLGDLPLTPEDVFAYLYAVLYAPGYRSRYAEFLKRDFPRIPLTADRALFQTLAALGHELIGLHLLQESPSPQPSDDTTSHSTKPASGRGGLAVRYPIAGSNRMDKVDYRPSLPSPAGGESVARGAKPAGGEGRVYINAEQYFDGVPQAVWEYHIGGYQVAAKWLKDRKDRLLSFDDLQHYQRVIAALAETIRLQAEIDAAIPSWPLQ